MAAKPFRTLTSAIALMSGLALNLPAVAQQESDEDQDTTHHHSDLEEVIVTASPIRRERFDILQTTSSLSGEALEESMGGNIGETLDGLPGLSNTYFGPGAGRPIIRGLGGDRIRVLIGGIGSIDASSTSPDHSVAVDALTAQRIEVIRGPATLLYGNNAVGGVINVLDGRIPFEQPEDEIDGAARLQYGSNADEVSLAGTADLRLNENWVGHVDGSYRDSGDIEIPGFLRSKRLRETDPLPADEEEVRGIAENSDVEEGNANAGLSYFFEDGYIGAAVGYQDKNYGIPAELEEEEEEEDGEGAGEEEGGVRIDIEQVRIDVMGEINRDFAIFETAKLRFGYGDYEHVELEGGEVGTTFLNDGYEGRVELVQQDFGGLAGAMGVQLRKRDFSAIGAEAFVPPSTTHQYGFFAMEEYVTGPWTLQGGLRLEFQDTKAPSETLERDFTGVSISGGASYLISDDILFGATVHRTERAPTPEELFSGGPHIATQTFEVGDPTLGLETATGGELILRKRGGRFTASATFFYDDFDDFVVEDFTGEVEDGLPVAIFRATDTEFYGFEAEVDAEVFEHNGFTGHFDFVFDYVKAEEKATNTPLPRIPPLSVQLGAEVNHEYGDFRLGLELAENQDRTAANELPSPGYASLSASLAVRPFGRERDVSLRIQGRNLTDETIRHHTSFLKDILPAPGRDIRIVLRAGF